MVTVIWGTHYVVVYRTVLCSWIPPLSKHAYSNLMSYLWFWESYVTTFIDMKILCLFWAGLCCWLTFCFQERVKVLKGEHVSSKWAQSERCWNYIVVKDARRYFREVYQMLPIIKHSFFCFFPLHTSKSETYRVRFQKKHRNDLEPYQYHVFLWQKEHP